MSDASLPVVLLRLVFAVAVVVGLLLLTARFTRRLGAGGAGPTRGAIRVVARQPLGRNTSVAVIETGGRTLVLGVTEHAISLLSEQELVAAPPEEAGSPPAGVGIDRRSVIDRLRDKTLRSV